MLLPVSTAGRADSGRADFLFYNLQTSLICACVASHNDMFAGRAPKTAKVRGVKKGAASGARGGQKGKGGGKRQSQAGQASGSLSGSETADSGKVNGAQKPGTGAADFIEARDDDSETNSV